MYVDGHLVTAGEKSRLHSDPFGVRIYEADNINESVRLIERIDFQLAFIDVILRDEDGITCARRIHQIKPATRIILISAYPDREFHRQGLDSGASAFLDKKNLDLPTIKHVIDDIQS